MPEATIRAISETAAQSARLHSRSVSVFTRSIMPLYLPSINMPADSMVWAPALSKIRFNPALYVSYSLRLRTAMPFPS